MTDDDADDRAALVDTDVATWLLVDADQAAPWREVLRGRLLAISFATYGELLALPHVKRWGPNRTEAWRAAIRRTFVVLPYTAEVAERWAPMHAKLRGHLHSRGTNDLWTAATALATTPPLEVATNNRSDFDTIAAEFGIALLSPTGEPGLTT